MLTKVQAERPEVTHVRTGNANSNAPMLAINAQMGFKPYKATTVWQLELSKLDNYL